MEWFEAWMEWWNIVWNELKMDNEIWCNEVWVKWIMEWNESQLWSGVKKWPATSYLYYSIAEKHQTLKTWNENEVEHGVKWMKCGWMNEMENGWVNEMENGWMNEMDHKWNESALMIL